MDLEFTFGEELITTLIDLAGEIQGMCIAFWNFLNGNLATVINDALDQSGLVGDVIQEVGSMLLDQPGGLLDHSILSFILGAGFVTICVWQLITWILNIIT